ncbi:hypothetical protein [Phaeobacter sp. C3_T13_0]|uniref:hypothetical protein n=1 Tax=Phaeobacter cretensis TaxID=3342641 RepID=UPI0039BD5C9E
MKISGQGNVSVYRMFKGDSNEQAASQQAQEQQTGQRPGGLESVSSLTEQSEAVTKQASMTGPIEGASMVPGAQYLRAAVQQKLQDLQSGCHAGPTPVSELIAQSQYREAQRVLS